MPRPRIEAKDPLKVAKVALLRSEGLKQSEIAKELKMPEPTVSRLLSKDGRASKFLKLRPPIFDWDRFTEDEKKILRATIEPDVAATISRQLVDLTGSGVSVEVKVIRVTGSPGSNAAQEAGNEQFYEPAVRHIWSLLSRAENRIIGMAWGNSLRRTLDSAERSRLASPLPNPSEALVIPLCGESLLSPKPSSSSSSSLAEGFGRLLTNPASNTPSDKFLSLGMIPVFLPGPRAFKTNEVTAVKRLLSFSSAYRKIFGVQPRNTMGHISVPLAERLDVVLTSISREGRPFGFGAADADVRAFLELNEYDDLIIGDIGGVPLPKRNLFTRQKKRLMQLRERWTGLRKRHIRKCAQNASRENGPAGVIVVCTGVDRAASIIEAARNGLLNHLVIDGDLALELAKRLAKK
jgi:predicted transcriptional regulator